ncbi:hypothetical protein M758_UG177200 [Ceratodon purpureus]|nr:hypothetical protein M758_UG177200 [Ceratodon purpureus]
MYLSNIYIYVPRLYTTTWPSILGWSQVVNGCKTPRSEVMLQRRSLLTNEVHFFVQSSRWGAPRCRVRSNNFFFHFCLMRWQHRVWSCMFYISNFSILMDFIVAELQVGAAP